MLIILLKCGCTDFYNGMSWSTGPNAASSNSGGINNVLVMLLVQHQLVYFDISTVLVLNILMKTITSSIGRVDATELSLESDTDLTVNESLQIPFSG